MDLLAKTVKNDLSGLNEVGTEFEHYLESILCSDFQLSDNEEDGNICNKAGQIFTSLMTTLVMAAKNGLDKSELDNILQDIGMRETARLELLQSYEKHRTRLMINLSRFGLFVPKLVDLRWKLELIEQDNLLCKRGELIYTIEMDILRNKYCTGKMLCSRIDEKYQKKSECSVVSRDTIVFHSTKLELLSLLSAFKDCINRVKILQE